MVSRVDHGNHDVAMGVAAYPRIPSTAAVYGRLNDIQAARTTIWNCGKCVQSL